ncbi:hypothetical protein EI94DRAFT_1747962 [Lactarius quietus]|nr:hypothetical protein EI94DRAFT_1747962 [Lactarius quietus]
MQRVLIRRLLQAAETLAIAWKPSVYLLESSKLDCTALKWTKPFGRFRYAHSSHDVLTNVY